MATVLTKAALTNLWASYHNTNEDTVRLFIDYIFGGSGAGSTFLLLSGGTMTGSIAMGGHNITGAASVGTNKVEALTGNLLINANTVAGQNLTINAGNDFQVNAGNNISLIQAAGTFLTLGKSNGALSFFQQGAVIRQAVDGTAFVVPVDLATALVEIQKLQTTVEDFRKALGNVPGGGYGLVEIV